MRDEIYNLLADKVDEVFLHFQEELGIMSGDIFPEDAFDLDNAIDNVADIIERVLQYQR